MYNPKIGERVYYTAPHGAKENGIVKSVNDDHAFVVFHCGGDWDNYKNYTGASCDQSRLSSGWVDENGHLMEEYCDHEYQHSAGKWQPINKMTCMHCGKVING